MEEMAAFFGCHVDTLRDNYSKVIESGREKGKASMRRSLFMLAQKGNLGAIVWFGKQYMGQSEHASIDLSTGLTVVWDNSLDKL
jgi:hypothetical protein